MGPFYGAHHFIRTFEIAVYSQKELVVFSSQVILSHIPINGPVRCITLVKQS